MTDKTAKFYKAFRNYMTNELGITRHDIEAWTKEAVATEAHKLVSGQNIQTLAADSIRQSVRAAVIGSGFSGPTSEVKRAIADCVRAEIEGQVVVTVKPRAKDDADQG